MLQLPSAVSQVPAMPGGSWAGFHFNFSVLNHLCMLSMTDADVELLMLRYVYRVTK